jgi:hypothetical protein
MTETELIEHVLTLPKVRAYIGTDDEIVRIIYVPERMINIVTRKVSNDSSQ